MFCLEPLFLRIEVGPGGGVTSHTKAIIFHSVYSLKVSPFAISSLPARNPTGRQGRAEEPYCAEKEMLSYLPQLGHSIGAKPNTGVYK